MVGRLIVKRFLTYKRRQQLAFKNHLKINFIGFEGHAQFPEVLLHIRVIVSPLRLHALSFLTRTISSAGRRNRGTAGGQALPVCTHEKCGRTSFSWCVGGYRCGYQLNRIDRKTVFGIHAWRW